MEHYPIIKHIDGEWHTSTHLISDRTCQIKMKPHKGCKIHIFDPTGSKVVKTFKYNFSTESYLLNKAKQWIELNK
jgi:hypothetical protein